MNTTIRPAATVATIFVLLCLVLASPARAQLTPDRAYYGIDRTIPMTVAMPSGVAGDVEIVLYKPDGEEAARAAAAEGAVDLSGLFPVFWTTSEPETMYAQLLVDDEPIGSPVVIVPMLTPNLARLNGRQAVFGNPPASMITYAGVRAWVDQHVVVETTLGSMEFRMRPDQAPNTVVNFVGLVEGGYYTDIIFHRIIGAKGGRQPFMAQVGDPTGTGTGGPGRFVDLEDSKLPHDFGVLSMARTGDPNTNGGQVFVCFSRGGTEFLDGQYCSFAQAVDGAETIIALENVQTDATDRPVGEPPRIKSAKTIPAPPFGTGPEPLERPSTDER